MPLDSTPRILRRPIAKPPGSTAPTGARGTRSPTSKLKAPQTISSGPCPGVDDDAADPVGPLNGIDLGDQAHHDVFEAFADLLDPLDHESQVIERGDQDPGVVGEGGEVTKPTEWSAHGSLSLGLLMEARPSQN